jgi:hypothetical protein
VLQCIGKHHSSGYIQEEEIRERYTRTHALLTQAGLEEVCVDTGQGKAYVFPVQA